MRYEPEDKLYCLYKLDNEGENPDLVNNMLGPSLASARLYALLAQAHTRTPLQRLTDKDYSS